MGYVWISVRKTLVWKPNPNLVESFFTFLYMQCLWWCLVSVCECLLRNRHDFSKVISHVRRVCLCFCKVWWRWMSTTKISTQKKNTPFYDARALSFIVAINLAVIFFRSSAILLGSCFFGVFFSLLYYGNMIRCFLWLSVKIDFLLCPGYFICVSNLDWILKVHKVWKRVGQVHVDP